jgi:hypothetical protein
MPTDLLPTLATAVSTAVAVAGVVGWLLKPHARALVDARLDERFRKELDPVRADVERHEEAFMSLPHTLRSLDHGIDGLTKAVERLTSKVEAHGEKAAATDARVGMLLDQRQGGERRQGGDRRRATPGG